MELEGRNEGGKALSQRVLFLVLDDLAEYFDPEARPGGSRESWKGGQSAGVIAHGVGQRIAACVGTRYRTMWESVLFMAPSICEIVAMLTGRAMRSSSIYRCAGRA